MTKINPTNVIRLFGRFSASFSCKGCILVQNGFVYRCGICPFKMDVECALLPETISHKAHGKSHILFLSANMKKPKDTDEDEDEDEDTKQNFPLYICNCCTTFITDELYYDCCICPNFKLDARCALLPLTVFHRFDKHRLELSFSKVTDAQDDVDFCEICERGIGIKRWFYNCKECTTLFHIDCIPCVGRLSKYKFGHSLKTKRHSCPLTCIRLLESYS